jgi:hypothetical protein
MIFNKFDTTDIVSGRIQPVSTGMWANGEPNQTSFFTSSVQSVVTGSNQLDPLNGLYYVNVYDQDPSSSLTADVYCSLTYGHVNGSGSSNYDLDTNTGSLIKPTQAIYSQYRNILLTPGDNLFSFMSGSVENSTVVDSRDIYVINFKTSKVKDRLDPGQFEITLSGSNGKITLIDDSKYNTSTLTAAGGKRYNIVSGSLNNGVTTVGDVYRAIGSVYPDVGIVVLNPTVISQIVGTSPNGSLGTPPSNSLTYSLMHDRLFSSIKSGASITARVTEYIPSSHYFVRVKNQESNYSNNPTYVISQEEDPVNAGNLRFADFSTDPKVYITTIGLYNENNDLVAVAKLSQPILKDFTSECLIRVKLDY